MKKKFYTLGCALILFTKLSQAQLADGSIAPDFTFTDMNGVSQNLYSYLNQGKYVALDVSATWCPPCWEYHSQIKTMEALYKKHDAPGDKKWKVLFIEGDPNTNDACMKNIAGCSSSTKGDWTKGTLYPMCNPPSGAALTKFTSDYKVTGFPFLYLICPNKKVYTKVLNDASLDWPVVLDWENVAKSCGSTTDINELNNVNSLTINNDPINNNLDLHFNINNNSIVKLQVVNSIGQLVETKNLGELDGGEHLIHYSTESLQRGLYFF